MTPDNLTKALAAKRASVAAKVRLDRAKTRSAAKTAVLPAENTPKRRTKPENTAKPLVTPSEQSSPTPPKRDRRKKAIGGTDLASVENPEKSALWRLFQLPQHAPEVVALVAPRLQGILDALLDGASRPGVQGANDRLTLGKMLGASWARTGAQQQADLMTAAGAVGDRIARAIARREGAFRRDPVTLDAVTGRKVAPVLTFLPTAQMLGEQARSSDACGMGIEADPDQAEGDGGDDEGAEEVEESLTRW